MEPQISDLTVMVVDDSVTNLKVAKNVLSDMVPVFTVPSATKMFQLLEGIEPALILLDIKMPEMSGLEAIRRLKDDPKYRDIPVIFLTSNKDAASELEGLNLGAVDYITKPFEPLLLKKRVEIHLMLHAQKETLERQKETLEGQKKALEKQKSKLREFNQNLWRMVEEETERVGRLQRTVLKTVVELVESRDDTTGGHITRTMKWLQFLLDGMEETGVYSEDLRNWNKDIIIQSSALHDVGKVSIDDAILKKPAKLTKEEFEAMKLHVDHGVNIIDKISKSLPGADATLLKHARILAHSHHEKWDGTGYPRQLKGKEIPLQGRLMAISDVFDALISKRPYKEPFTPEEAVKIIIDGSGTHFDPALVEVFKSVKDKFLKYGSEDIVLNTEEGLEIMDALQTQEAKEEEKLLELLADNDEAPGQKS
ncbi:MAG: response regulator [Deltaproteobacteria bacterium]|jgi:putative two-component system response regulator|nr:response regulator [Deltaproteobacteria bacterium]